MKKISLFLVMLFLATSLSASYVDKAEKSPKLTAKYARAMQLMRTAERKALNRPITTASQADAPTQHAASKLPIAKSADETIVLNFDEFSFFEYYPETGDWFISMSCYDEDKPEYNYIVKFDYIAPEDGCYGTFTTDDFDHLYSYIYTPDTVVYYEDITLTISEEQVSGSLSQVRLEATILGDDGNNYEIHCLHKILTPKDQIESVINDATFTRSSTDFTMAGSNDQMQVSLVVFEPIYIIGKYDVDDIDLRRSKFYHNGTKITPMDDIVASVTAAQVDGKLSYVAEVSFMSTDTINYALTINAPLPAPVDTVDLVCPNLAIDDSWAALGLIYATASNEEWDFVAAFPGYVIESVYSDEITCYMTNKHTGMDVEAIQISAQMSKDNNGNWTMTGWIRCTDNIIYNLHLTWTVPAPTSVVKVAFDTSVAATFYQNYNELRLDAFNDDYSIQLDIYDLYPGCSFDWQNAVPIGCKVQDYQTMKKFEVGDIKNGSLVQVGDTTKITASLICFNAVQYDVEMWYVAPTPTETVKMEFPVQFYNLFDYSMFQLEGFNENQSVYVSITPMTNQVEGTYINDGMFGRFGQEGGRYDFVRDYTYISVYNEDLEYYEMYEIEKGEMVVTMDADSNIVALVDVVCNNAVRYQLTLTTEYDIPHLEYDEPDRSVDRIYTAKDILTTEDMTADYGMIYFSVVDANKKDMASFYFFSDTIDQDILIPAGTYTIDSSEQPGSILANFGVIEGGVYPSFYGELEYSGALKIPVWLLTSGSAEVRKTANNKLYIEFNAYNSYNRPVHIIYDGTQTDLPNVQSQTNETHKVIRNGELYIIRNGKAYNMMGTIFIDEDQQ